MKTKFKVGDKVSLVHRDNVLGVGVVTVVENNGTFWVQRLSGETIRWYGDAQFDVTGREIGDYRYPYLVQVVKET